MPEPAAKEAKEHLLEFAEECVNDSAMAIDFYSRKLGAQWEAPMYQCYVMNIYQILLYGGVFVYLLAGRKKEQQIEHYVLLIGVFGGFLFSAMWEAKAKICVPLSYDDDFVCSCRDHCLCFMDFKSYQEQERAIRHDSCENRRWDGKPAF